MTTRDAERQAIRDAMARLLDGAPIRSDGKLTIKSLADEAAVKRWLLTHRHTDLQSEFRAKIASHGSDPAPVRQLKDELTELRAENHRLRKQLRESRQTIKLLERHIAVDALEAIHHEDSEPHPPRLRPVR